MFLPRTEAGVQRRCQDFCWDRFVDSSLDRPPPFARILHKAAEVGKIRILRQLPGSTQKKEIFIDLTAIEKNKAEDVALVANDVVDVPISGTKSILRSLLGTVVPTISQLPVRVIP